MKFSHSIHPNQSNRSLPISKLNNENEINNRNNLKKSTISSRLATRTIGLSNTINNNNTNTGADAASRKALKVLSDSEVNKKNNNFNYNNEIPSERVKASRASLTKENQINSQNQTYSQSSSQQTEADDETEDENEIDNYINRYSNIDEHQRQQQQHDRNRQYHVYVDEQVNQVELEEAVEEIDDLSIKPSIQNNFAIYDDITDEELEIDEESNEEDLEEEEDDDEFKVVPMSPKWNENIYNELTKVINKFHRDSPDPEDEDTYDVTMCAEYAPDIFNYLHKLEISLAPNPKYMDQQDELSWENRSTLINWVVQVHNRFNLLPETLFLTINLIDRFLSKRVISLSRFQLCGAVALFIAAKYEEINCPSVQQMAYMVSNDYTTEELLRAERFMIDILEFEMGWPGPMSFLRRTSKADDYDNETRTLAKYFLEITIMDPRFVSSPSSWLAAGAHYLSRVMLYRGDWTEAHVYYSGYTESQLKPLADILLDCCMDYKNHHKSIFEKYSERRFKRSSIFVQEYISNVYG